MEQNQKKSIQKIIWSWIKSILSAIGILILIKAFLFDFYIVPSSSMESSILKGDFIIGSKLHFGPRLPMTPLNIPFTHQYLGEDKKSYSTLISFDYHRIPGFSDIERFDPLIFNYPVEKEHPVDKRTFYVKRVIGLPGDTFQTINKLVHINSNIIPDPIDTQYDYVIYPGKGFDQYTFHQLGISQYRWNSEHNFFQVSSTKENIDFLKTKDNVKSIKRIDVPRFSKNELLYPEADHLKWNTDNYGPLIIPSRGLMIHLEESNYAIYAPVIQNYEHQKIATIDDEIYINGLQTETYTFQMDYFFVMGDNRDNSSDSRFWGFVPEDHVVGKAVTTIYSIDKEKNGFLQRIRWDRFFKSIN